MKVRLQFFIIFLMCLGAKLSYASVGSVEDETPKTPTHLLRELGAVSPGGNKGRMESINVQPEEGFLATNPMKAAREATSGPALVIDFPISIEKAIGAALPADIAYVLEGDGLSKDRKTIFEGLSVSQKETFDQWVSNVMLYYAWDKTGVARQVFSAIVGAGAGWCAKSGTWSSWAFSMYPRMGVEPVIEEMEKQGNFERMTGWALYGYAQATLNPIYMAQMYGHVRDDCARAFVYMRRTIPHKKENCGIRRFCRAVALTTAALDSLPELYIFMENTLRSSRSWAAYPFFYWQSVLERDLLLRDTARKISNTIAPESELLATKRAKLVSCVEGFSQAVRDPSMTGKRLELIHNAFMCPEFDHGIFIGRQASRWPLGIQTVGTDKSIDEAYKVSQHAADKIIRLLEVGLERRQRHGYPEPKREDTARFVIKKTAGFMATGAFWAAGSAIYSTIAPVMGDEAALALTIMLTGPRMHRGVVNIERWVAGLYDAWMDDSHFGKTKEYNSDVYINIRNTRFGQRLFLGLQGTFMSLPIIFAGAVESMEGQGLDPALIAVAALPFGIGEGAFVANQAIKEVNEAVTLGQHIPYLRKSREEVLKQRRLLRFADDILEETKEADESVVTALAEALKLDEKDILLPSTPTMAQQAWGWTSWAGQGLYNVGGVITECLGCGSRKRTIATVVRNPTTRAATPSIIGVNPAAGIAMSPMVRGGTPAKQEEWA